MELIVTLVVLGLTFSMIPAIFAQEERSQEASQLQEALFATSSKMGQILSYPWDEATLGANLGILDGAIVLDTNGSNAMTRVVGSNRRIGHFAQSGSRKFATASTWATTTLGKELNRTDDIDDFITVDTHLIGNETTNYGYKANYIIDITITYVNDALASGSYNDANLTFDFNQTALGTTSNLKRISITARDAQVGDERSLTMTSFSANIGEASYASRRFTP